ncbi:MAG: hypothetical protein ACOH2V_00850 [Candidatus Saccharimonadaceae bacterium]
MIFRQYKRKGLSEMTPVTEYLEDMGDLSRVSISKPDADLDDVDFEQGYVARNPKNHADMWYVAKKYFDENLEEVF